MKNMRTICLCGSTRFADHFQRLNAELSKAGHVVYSIAVAKEDGEGMTDEQKLVLDAVHMGKIANSDSVHFINIDGYMGESSRREFYFACTMGKKVSFEDMDQIPEGLLEHMQSHWPTRFEVMFHDTAVGISELIDEAVEAVVNGLGNKLTEAAALTMQENGGSC